MKKLRLGFVIALLLSLAALILAACGKDLPPLEKPANVRRDDAFMVWNEVENAAGYTVEIDGVSYDCAEAKFDLSVLTEPADYIIKVKANGDGKAFSDSAWVSRGYTLKAEDMFFLLIEGGSAYELSRAYAVKDGICEIPRTYNGRPVTAIGAEAFKDNTELVSVTLPEGVTVIGESAFEGCTALERVTLPDGVRSIERRAFRGCTQLATADLPEGLLSVGESAFKNCESYAPTVPESVQSIGSEAFAYSGIKRLTLPKSFTVVPSFANCTKLSEIVLHDGVAALPSNAFKNTAIENIFIPDGIALIPCGAFRDCSALREVRLPQSLTEIEMSAFTDCASLETITLPESLKSISAHQEGDPQYTQLNAIGTFKGCTALREINFPNAIEFVGQETFLDTAWYNAQPNGAVYCGRVFYKYKGIAAENTTLTIKEGTVSVSPRACNVTEKSVFGQKTIDLNITKVIFPNSLISIHDGAFASSCRLTEIVLPPNLKTLGNSAFGKIYGKIILNDKLETIGDDAILGTQEMQNACDEIRIPKSVKFIGKANFQESRYFNRLVFENPKGWYWDTPILKDCTDDAIKDVSIYYELSEFDFIHAYAGKPLAVPEEIFSSPEQVSKLFDNIEISTVMIIIFPTLTRR